MAKESVAKEKEKDLPKGDPRLERWESLEFVPYLQQHQGGVTTGIVSYKYEKTFNAEGEPVTQKKVGPIKTLNIRLDGQGRGYKPVNLEEAVQLLAAADAPNYEKHIVLYQNREAPKEIKSLEAQNRALQSQLEAQSAELDKLQAEVYGTKRE